MNNSFKELFVEDQ